MTVFLRVLDASVEEKRDALLRAVAAFAGGETSQDVMATVFDRDPKAFSAVPGSPFAYWVSSRILNTFQEVPAFNAGSRVATVGLQSSDDFRFLRLWFEPHAGASYRPFAKGGSFSPFYADLYASIIWDRDGHEVKAFAETTPGSKHWSRNIRSAEHYLRPGLTWPARTNGLSLRALPAGSVFGHKGPVVFVDDNTPDNLLALSAVVNSRTFGYFVSVQLARTELAQSYEVGLIQQTPVPNLSPGDTRALAELARRSWSLKRSLDTTAETSRAFLLPPGLNERATGLDQATAQRELEETQRKIDDAVSGLYRVGPEERAAISATSTSGASAGDELTDSEDEEADRDQETPTGPSANVVGSWLVGVAFGRFDPRLATGERAIPPEPEPFDPLPSRSPGMYPEGEEPADRPDILVDDEGHADDLAARAIAVAERVKVDAPENLRAWLAKEFFPLHIKMYSKSRRKAPIYWQLATPSASYSVWLYIHAFSKDTLFRVQNDYVAPKAAHEERRLESLTSELRDGATAAQRKTLAAQEAVVDEVRAFLDEVKLVAPLWNPNLDDGVIINFAPLWRLVPQNKSWQKELKSTWDALCEGKYDWAHLAMHLWPQRVVPECAKDRSLAIAHGLEDVFWVEGTNGKWTARNTPTRNVDELVRERTSPAVTSALKSLLEAPAAAGKSGGRRGGGRRQSTAATDGGDG
jgi:hypothetical protein